MQCARARNCDLRKQFCSGLEKIEIADIDWPGPANAAFHEGGRLRAASAAGRCAFGIRGIDGIDAEVAELLVEKTVIGTASKFSVGHETQANALLQTDGIGDRRIFGVCKFALRNRSARKSLATCD